MHGGSVRIETYRKKSERTSKKDQQPKKLSKDAQISLLERNRAWVYALRGFPLFVVIVFVGWLGFHLDPSRRLLAARVVDVLLLVPFLLCRIDGIE